MRKEFIKTIKVLLGCVLGIIFINFGFEQYLNYINNNKIETVDIPIEEIDSSFSTKSVKEGLEEALEYYEVYHPDIVYAQAILETGNFKSDLCINGNNLFGLYNSQDNKYYTYGHWSESIEDYIKLVQYKYDPSESYYKFLSDIGYAKDPNYIKKLKEIVNDKRRSK